MGSTYGELVIRDAMLGAHVIELGARLEHLEKLARKTPPRTLLEERRKVAAARAALDGTRSDLRLLLYQHAAVRVTLGRNDSGLSAEYLRIRVSR